MPGIYLLDGVNKHYDWGGKDFIPELLQIDNSKGKPYAEYWLGTHPLGESKVHSSPGKFESLSSITGKLSFLLKVLDVKDMLSIQVHPTRSAAAQEFARENTAGIPLDDPKRNYKDDNHKPELMVALDDFWLLHGFKPPEEMTYTLLNVVELRELLPIFNESGYEGLYKHVMTIPQSEVNRVLQPLLSKIKSVNTEESSKSDEDFWVARAAGTFNCEGNIDRGIFSIYLFNLVQLKKGEGIFQAAGVPHAYLEGQNVEIMANSDNVLRGGLTSKHIDVNELLKHVKCEATYPFILAERNNDEQLRNFPVPVDDFHLEMMSLNQDQFIDSAAHENEIIICTHGSCHLEDLVLQAGQPSAFIEKGKSYKITGVAKETVLFRASGRSSQVNN